MHTNAIFFYIYAWAALFILNRDILNLIERREPKANVFQTQPNLCLCRNSNNHKDSAGSPAPMEVPPWASEYSWQPCVSLMVDKMVDVDLPLTMN